MPFPTDKNLDKRTIIKIDLDVKGINKLDKEKMQDEILNPLISVIIPVYNVEEYVESCIISVINQQYNNLEIILVDDGSTDKSGEICDQFALQDARIKVFHKKNGGLSDARNYGLANSSGDYIGFVDSDDYISTELYSTLLELCLKYDSKISCARFDTFGEDKWNIPKETGKIEVLSSCELLKMIIWPWLYPDKFASISVWDRLYKKDLIEQLIFPKGKIYEDIIYSTKAIIGADKCVYINKILYHYRLRDGSISGNNYSYNEQWITDKFPIEMEQIRILQANGYHELATMAKYRSLFDLFRLKYWCNDSKKIKLINSKISELNLSVMEIMKNLPGFKTKMKTIIKVVFMAPYICWKMKNFQAKN